MLLSRRATCWRWPASPASRALGLLTIVSFYAAVGLALLVPLVAWLLVDAVLLPSMVRGRTTGSRITTTS